MKPSIILTVAVLVVGGLFGWLNTSLGGASGLAGLAKAFQSKGLGDIMSSGVFFAVFFLAQGES